VITAIDDGPVGSVDDLFQIIATHGPGDTVSISVSRGSRQLEVTATFETRRTSGAGG
jgi:S1-C subfamily serine protease